MSGGPLSGIRVLDLSSVVVGPVATQFLADYGADVIKVEPPEGDLLRKLGGASVTPDMASKFLHFNRNKRSVVLDLKRDDARGVLRRICAESDVVVVNMRGPALQRSGLTCEDLRAVNERLIYCRLAGFGQAGRYANKPAYDTIIQGSTGVAAALSRVSGTPAYVPMVMADHVVGLIAVQMILLALYRRARTGLGDSIEVPMFENMAAFVMAEHMYLRTFIPPLGGTGDPRIIDPESRPLPTRDGYICVSANTDQQVFAFFAAVGRPELKSDPRFCSVAARLNNVRAYFDFRSRALSSRTTAEWLEIFDRDSVPAMPYHTFESLMEDPHLREVGLLREVEHPSEGPIWNINLPNTLKQGGAREDYLPPPKLGEHTHNVLEEFGYSQAEISRLTAASEKTSGATGANESSSR